MSFSLKAYLDPLKAQIEDTLQSLLPSLRSDFHPLLFEAASYSLLGPGKRLRPLLTLCTADSLKGSVKKALVPACALEILHTYSLIHDDLPCMDDDDLRRGRPTLHKVYLEGQAVLVGDLFLTFAFEVLASAPLLAAEEAIKLILTLAKKSGAKGMILGQSLDLASEGRSLLWEQVREMHKRKTGDLISASLEFGAIIAGASEETQRALSEIGQKIGLAFQIVDDILDVEGDPSTLGKPLHSDIDKKKNTSVSLLGLEQARALSNELLIEVLKECEKVGLQDSPLTELLPKLILRSF